MYLVGIFTFGFTSLSNTPKAQATDPEITSATLSSGSMPETATTIAPPGGSNTASAVYDFGSTYSVTSMLVSCTASSPTSGSPGEWGVRWALSLSEDGISWSPILSGDGVVDFPDLGCHSQDITPTVAKYAKWEAGADTSPFGGSPPDGTYTITLSDPHLYGTPLGSHRLNHHPSG